MEEREQYSREFKRDAGQLARLPDQSFQGVARALEISASSLHRWACELDAQGSAAFPGHGRQVLSAEQSETKRLQRELESVWQERDVHQERGCCLARKADQRQDQQLSAEIVGIHTWSKSRYGVPRVHAEWPASCARLGAGQDLLSVQNDHLARSPGATCP